MRLDYLLAAPGIPVRGPSGSSAHVRAVVEALRAEHEVRLYTLKDSDRRGVHGDEIASIATGITGWPSWLGRWRELREVIAARNLARRVLQTAWAEHPPDLIIERHSLFSDASWRVGERLGVPWALEVNAPLAMERARFEELRQPELAARWEREVLLAAPLVVAVSSWLKRWLEQEVGCRNVAWVPNGVRALRGDRVRGRERLGLADGEFALGFVGSMKPWHGVERLGRFARAAEARLVLIGVGEVAGVPDNTVCTGFLEGQELADAVAALDVGLAPYPADAPPWFCPLKVFDYRAQGTPVVASDVGDVRTFVKGGGSVVPAGDDDAFIEAIRGWRGRPVRPRVRSWARVAAELLRAADPLLDGGSNIPGAALGPGR